MELKLDCVLDSLSADPLLELGACTLYIRVYIYVYIYTYVYIAVYIYIYI